MKPQLNHTIVWCRDQQRSAEYLTQMLGLPPATRFGPFLVVPLGNGVSLDFYQQDELFPQHYAFLIDERDFDGVLERLKARGQLYWADPGRTQPGQINHHDGGRGLYFADPDAHLLEVITRPYGGG